MFKHSKYGAFVATVGMVLALGGASFAVADGGYDIPSGSEAAGISPVIGKSWTRWAHNPASEQPALPATAPQYSQVNFQTNPLDTGGLITTSQAEGQAHAEAAVLLRKAQGGGDAQVTCDLRMSGAAASNEFVTTIVGSAAKVTLPLVGSKAHIPAGTHNIGVRCWATGNTVYLDKVDLHAVIYGPAQ